MGAFQRQVLIVQVIKKRKKKGKKMEKQSDYLANVSHCPVAFIYYEQ